jgi:hypothetical protein
MSDYVLELDDLWFKPCNHNGRIVIQVDDKQNKHSALLDVTISGVFHTILSNFPRNGKRHFEMLYVAEANKSRLLPLMGLRLEVGSDGESFAIKSR